MSKSFAKALLNRSAMKVAKTSPVLTAGQKAAATKARQKMERVAAEQAAALAYASMTPGQKAAYTKRQGKPVAPVAAPVAPAPVAAPALDYASMTAGQKAAYTKRHGKPAAPVAAPAAPVAAPAAPVAAPAAPVAAPAAITGDTLSRLLALAPALKAAGLI